MSKVLRFTLLLLVAGMSTVYAQETKKENPVTIYGFVRSDMYVDTYKGINVGSELFNILPNFDGKVDENGKDINNQASFNLTSIQTRFGLKVAGPEIFGAKTTANVEGDFCGTFSDNYIALFRIRQANTVFSWKKSSLLVGMTWHPFWGGKHFPTVGNFATGAPFQPFNRSPLIRYDYKAGDFTLSGALVSELIFRSSGPIGKTDQYARNAAIPEVYAGVDYSKGGLTIGLGASYKAIKPNQTLTNDSNKVYNTNTLLHSFTGMGFVEYSKGKLLILAKSVLGQNLSYQTMPGGYGVSTYDKSGVPSVSYTNYASTSSFINAVYGKKWQIGIFAGYQKNLGTAKALYNSSSIYGLQTNIQSMYRIAPCIALNVSKVRIAAEYETTSAYYGTGAMDLSDGLYDKTHKATNHRGLLAMTYFF